MALAIPSLAALRHVYRILKASPLMDGQEIREGAPEPGKTGTTLSIYPYSQARNEGPVGLEPIIAVPSIAVARMFALGEDPAPAILAMQRVNRLLHGSSGPTDYGLVVACLYAREISALEPDASGKRWKRIGSIFEITVRSQS